MVIYVTWRHHSLHNSHNYLLMAAAVTDVITGLVTQPLSIAAIFLEVQQDVHCGITGIKDAQAACNLLCNMTSLFTLIILSFERILVVWRDTLVTPRQLLALVVGCSGCFLFCHRITTWYSLRHACVQKCSFSRRLLSSSSSLPCLCIG